MNPEATKAFVRAETKVLLENAVMEAAVMYHYIPDPKPASALALGCPFVARRIACNVCGYPGCEARYDNTEQWANSQTTGG